MPGYILETHPAVEEFLRNEEAKQTVLTVDEIAVKHGITRQWLYELVRKHKKKEGGAETPPEAESISTTETANSQPPSENQETAATAQRLPDSDSPREDGRTKESA